MTTTTKEITMDKFTVGTSYSCRSIADHETVYMFWVVARTARFVTFADRWGDERRVAVRVDEHGEWAMPHGVFANCAVVHACSPVDIEVSA
jgi:hypothetical protein